MSSGRRNRAVRAYVCHLVRGVGCEGMPMGRWVSWPSRRCATRFLGSVNPGAIGRRAAEQSANAPRVRFASAAVSRSRLACRCGQAMAWALARARMCAARPLCSRASGALASTRDPCLPEGS
eukprot:1668265-Pyramimonas_sp.AAC.2